MSYHGHRHLRRHRAVRHRAALWASRPGELVRKSLRGRKALGSGAHAIGQTGLARHYGAALSATRFGLGLPPILVSAGLLGARAPWPRMGQRTAHAVRAAAPPSCGRPHHAAAKAQPLKRRLRQRPAKSERVVYFPTCVSPAPWAPPSGDAGAGHSLPTVMTRALLQRAGFGVVILPDGAGQSVLWSGLSTSKGYARPPPMPRRAELEAALFQRQRATARTAHRHCDTSPCGLRLAQGKTYLPASVSEGAGLGGVPARRGAAPPGDRLPSRTQPVAGPRHIAATRKTWDSTTSTWSSLAKALRVARW